MTDPNVLIQQQDFVSSTTNKDIDKNEDCNEIEKENDEIKTFEAPLQELSFEERLQQFTQTIQLLAKQVI